METGEMLTRWTARIAVLLYAAALAARPWRPRWARWGWTAGCAVYLLHVACAFAYYHDWSHAEAYTATARQTFATTGLDWGGGVYVNYAFTLVWLADVLWWWIAADSYLARPRWIEGGVQGYLGFVAFNATVVFAAGVGRWLGVAACLVVLASWLAPPWRIARGSSERS